MTARYEYMLIVEQADANGPCIAFLGESSESRVSDSPMQGEGPTPLEAVRALCESIREWPLGGAARWLQTEPGKALTRRFVFDPNEPDMGRPKKEPAS